MLAGVGVLASCTVVPDAGGAVGPAVGESGPRPEVSTDAGRLRGVVDGNVVRYRGVPYAQPPVGDLRWAAPRRVIPAAETRDAAASGPACVQNAEQLPEPSLSPFQPAVPAAQGPGCVGADAELASR
ncbi:carboxylesterase family protein [Pseudonocardia sp. HH130630-07]|uniref:carboxylesterase family protein n=1 Tax=Pseudonocardia sp. HH130630-07 TaxID=1690815 RepID=UPI0009F39694|nr:carboxylesterase family protein [Pseudonocardia sp. HH130630-07]